MWTLREMPYKVVVQVEMNCVSEWLLSPQEVIIHEVKNI